LFADPSSEILQIFSLLINKLHSLKVFFSKFVREGLGGEASEISPKDITFLVYAMVAYIVYISKSNIFLHA